MYKQRLLFFLLMLGTLVAGAQVTMTLQVPPVGVLVKNQLWNMLLVNTSSRPLTVKISMVLLDEKTNQPVLTGEGLPFILDKGAKQIQAKDLGAIQYMYNGPAVLADHNANGLLPIGNYQACYTIQTNASKAPAAENCIQLAVDPLSPPLLNTPADEGNIYTSYPQFTWLPPTPIQAFSDLGYDLVLVEVLPGQGKADAIEQNIPVYSGGLTRNLFDNYPSSYRSLDTGRLYAWRIVATNGGLPVSMSEIWTFKVAAPFLPALKVEHSSYLELTRGLNASVATADSGLYLTYDNVAADTVVSYSIAGIQDAGNPVVQKGQLVLKRGRNWLEIPLTAGYSSGRLYQFQFINSRNETWSLKFTPASK